MTFPDLPGLPRRSPSSIVTLYVSPSTSSFRCIIVSSYRHLALSSSRLTILVFTTISISSRISSRTSSRIYSVPIMLRASFLGFVAGWSFCNISSFLWLDNYFIVSLWSYDMFYLVIFSFYFEYYFSVTSVSEYKIGPCLQQDLSFESNKISS